MKTFQSYTVLAEHTGLTVENYLKQVLNYSGRKLQQLTRKKGIQLNGKTVYLQTKVKPRDTLGVLVLQDKSAVTPQKGELSILYEDEDMLVVDKPPYLLVHPAGRTTGGTLANHLAYYLLDQGEVNTTHPVHRLDRDTSGCVIFAKSSRSQTMLEQQLKDRTLTRVYWALARGAVTPPAGTINAPIGPDHSYPNRRAVIGQGEKAVTHYRTIGSFFGASLLELSLDTGKTHQIRVHLAHIGHPVIGDSMYGAKSCLISRQALHAASVTFTNLKHGDKITVRSPLPADFDNALQHYAKSLSGEKINFK